MLGGGKPVPRVVFRTPQLARRISRAVAVGAPFAVTGDTVYGNDRRFGGWKQGLCYVWQ